MARMLEALKQLEARSPHVPAVARPVPPENHDEFARTETTEPPRAEAPAEAEPILVEPAPSSAVASPPEARNRCHRELAENILARLPSSGRALLAFASAEQDMPPEGLIRSLATLLAGRTDGGVLLVERGHPEAPDPSDPPSGRTWADVFSGKVDWQAMVRETEVAGLKVLVEAGRPPETQNQPAEWNPIQFVKTLRQTYAIVLFDVVPLNDLHASPWIGCCDGTYLLVHLHQTPRRAARHAARAIRKRCGRFLGCIVVD